MSPSSPHSIHFEQIGATGAPVFWAHGWGQTHASLKPLAQSLQAFGQHTLVDLPGFGQSPQPDADWSTADYADAMAEFIQSRTDQKIFWVGHSFGCRVGIQLAARHPDLVAGLVLIAAAGLKRKRHPLKTLYFKARIYTYKGLKKLIPFGLPEAWLIKTFASRDYAASGAMKNILIKTVNEDLSDVARSVQCPVLLYFGSDDSETPPEFGQRYARLIPKAELIVLDGFDHYTILTQAAHQLGARIKRFMTDNQPALTP